MQSERDALIGKYFKELYELKYIIGGDHVPTAEELKEALLGNFCNLRIAAELHLAPTDRGVFEW